MFFFDFIQGAWKPSLNISTVLTSIQLLMAEPNPDDPLMADIVSHRNNLLDLRVFDTQSHCAVFICFCEHSHTNMNMRQRAFAKTFLDLEKNWTFFPVCILLQGRGFAGRITCLDISLKHHKSTVSRSHKIAVESILIVILWSIVYLHHVHL